MNTDDWMLIGLLIVEAVVVMAYNPCMKCTIVFLNGDVILKEVLKNEKYC